MSEQEHAKSLLLGDDVIDVKLLPIGVATIKDMKEDQLYVRYDPFNEQERNFVITMEVVFRGTESELKGIQHAKKVSLIPRD